ncbi:histidine phosphatase family protein [Dyella mobilis]|uniref:phosphoglycerate mutase (2,3-diphosphoglycerate-dependent) n=1 Tax=Dyella mobilis TaxID=1849582 RepID=A0ABS2KFB3_9GAMM|nr:phosphoglycerate mutase family protein [Dyella mobilis]MBM7129849.1 histidine phosphatase family protein [Dyella mobilis]GLQ97887.1 hypothetical protein GCM10007863_23070 [Dyella mobilis]
MTIYFVRHGESLANEQNYFAGILDSPLTALGRRQAREAAARIRKLHVDFDEVHISTLGRARETARTILGDDLAPRAKIVFSDALIERDFGVFAGENKTLLKKALGYERFDHFIHSKDGQPPSGESWMDMYERCKAYHEQVLAPLEQAGKHVLVVAHKYIVEMFALIASGRTPSEYIDFKLPNSHPLSWNDLTALTASSSSVLNHVAEHVEIHLPLWTLGAALAGLVMALSGAALPGAWVDAGILALLAVNAFFLALRIETGVLDPRKGSHTVSLVVLIALRLLVCGLLMFYFNKSWVHLVGLLLLMPPAFSVPTFSLSRGGDYFFAARNTLWLSILSPFALIAVAWFDPWMTTDIHGLQRFAIVLLVAMAAPILLAQSWRRSQPIRAGSISTNWGWIGSAATIPLAFLAVANTSSPTLITDLWLEEWHAYVYLLSPLAVLMFVRFGSMLYVQIHARFSHNRIASSIASDLHLMQSLPNIFLWFSLLTPFYRMDYSALIVGTMLGFFVFAFIDDAIVVARFRSRIRSKMEAASGHASITPRNAPRSMADATA